MHVIGQHGELDESHTESIGSSHESFAHGLVLTPTAHVLEPSFDAQRDVHRMARLQRWALRMLDMRTLPLLLATGAFACAAPRLELETSLMQDSHDHSNKYDERESAGRATNALFSHGNGRVQRGELHLIERLWKRPIPSSCFPL